MPPAARDPTSPVSMLQRDAGPSISTRGGDVPTGEMAARTAMQDEWLWGWDPTPGIVSVWAEADGRATVWRREPETGVLVREEERFRPWLLLDRIDDLLHLGPGLGPAGDGDAQVWFRELEGPGALRFLVSAHDGRALATAVLQGASVRLRQHLTHLRDLGAASVLSLPPEEQYLVATGRTYFRDLPFDRLRRLQFDLETTGLDPTRDRIFMIAVRDPEGTTRLLEARERGDAGEAGLIRDLLAAVQEADPDVIENHNLHGFDLPFVATRARRLGVPLALGRLGKLGLRERAARRGTLREGEDGGRRVRFVAPGRELIDTLDAVQRYDFAARDLPGHGLKAVARHLGVSGPDRELIPGAQIYTVYRTDPERVRRYAGADVDEVAAISRLLGGAAYALARMAPRRYERLADAGPATGVIDPLLVRAYLRAGAALPAHQRGMGRPTAVRRSISSRPAWRGAW
ncbi:MAG TPA: ribonuclease H-like domain-containing protein [Longimicrobium sp.]